MLQKTAPYTVQTEPDPVGMISEFKRLWPEHWGELGEDTDTYDLDVDLDIYIAMHKRNMLHVTSVRDAAGALMAYHLVVIRRHPHCNRLSCQDLVSFVRAGQNRIWVLVAMYRHSVAALKARGVTYFGFRVKVRRDFGAVLRRLGFAPCEVVYTMNTERGAHVDGSARL